MVTILDKSLTMTSRNDYFTRELPRVFLWPPSLCHLHDELIGYDCPSSGWADAGQVDLIHDINGPTGQPFIAAGTFHFRDNWLQIPGAGPPIYHTDRGSLDAHAMYQAAYSLSDVPALADGWYLVPNSCEITFDLHRLDYWPETWSAETAYLAMVNGTASEWPLNYPNIATTGGCATEYPADETVLWSAFAGFTPLWSGSYAGLGVDEHSATITVPVPDATWRTLIGTTPKLVGYTSSQVDLDCRQSSEIAVDLGIPESWNAYGYNNLIHFANFTFEWQIQDEPPERYWHVGYIAADETA